MIKHEKYHLENSRCKSITRVSSCCQLKFWVFKIILFFGINYILYKQLDSTVLSPAIQYMSTKIQSLNNDILMMCKLTATLSLWLCEAFAKILSVACLKTKHQKEIVKQKLSLSLPFLSVY